MAKGIIVVKKPENCQECPFLRDMDYTCGVFEIQGETYTYVVPETGIPNWCPIRPMPDRKEVQGAKIPMAISDFERRGRQLGWNECIDRLEWLTNDK